MDTAHTWTTRGTTSPTASSTPPDARQPHGDDRHDGGPAGASATARAEHVWHGEHAAPADHGAHDKHEGHDPEVFRRRFWLSLLLTIPVVIFSEMIQDWFGYSTAGIPGDHLVAPVLGTFVFVYGGHVFLVGGWREIRDRQPGMMLLTSLAITVAFLASAATVAGLLAFDFWWELSALVTVMLLGHWQEMRALGRTRGALAALAELIPAANGPRPTVRRDGKLNVGRRRQMSPRSPSRTSSWRSRPALRPAAQLRRPRPGHTKRRWSGADVPTTAS